VTHLAAGPILRVNTCVSNLRTVLVITDADGTLVTKTVSPEATNVNVGLWNGSVHVKQPGTKDGLGQNITDSVGDDFSVNGGVAGTVGDTPDDWVGSPDDKGEGGDHGEEVSNLLALGVSSLATTNGELEDDNKEGNAGNGVPSPLLRSTFVAKGSKETGQDHDDIGNDGDEDVTTVKTSEKRKIEKKEWGGDGPVDVTGPVDLAVDIVVSVWDVLVGLSDTGVVVRDTVTGGL